MKYSINWLKKFVDLPILESDLQIFLDKMAIDGFETESIQLIDIDPKVVIATIESVEKHPNADKLYLCQVRVQEQKLQIVCGANNLYPQMKVALAQIGSKLPNGVKIKASKIRSVNSQGMLCSPMELGMNEDHEGILDLTVHFKDYLSKLVEGQSLRQILNLPEMVVDFNITPNRGYVLSHYAMAKEIAILNNLAFKQYSINKIKAENSNICLAKVKQNAKKACPKYLTRMIEGIDSNQKTPQFISNQLKKLDLNTIYPVVDILNFVMIELGQPMHAFDADTIKAPIEVGFSNWQKSIKLLNGDSIDLDDSTLLIKDQKSVIAIAGVMGCFDSAVGHRTKNIILESAYFDSKTISGKARHYNLSSDAAYRYERGVDSNLAQIAIERATELISHYLGGKVGPIHSEISEINLPKINKIEFNIDKINQVLGLTLAESQICQFLSRIGKIEKQNNRLFFTPHQDRFDLEIQEDLIEEIIRIYGYQNIQTRPVKIESKINLAPQFNHKRIRDFFVDKAYHEVINFSFVDANLQAKIHPNIEAIFLDNPIAQDKSVMRYSLFSGLISAYLQNEKYQQFQNRLFEIGLCFAYDNNHNFKQIEEIGGLISGDRYPRNWANSKAKTDFFDLKGDLESFFTLSGHLIKFEKQNHLAALHPEQSAKLVLNDQVIGYLGYLNPKLLNELNIKNSLLVFEFMLDKVIDKPNPNFQSFSRLPEIKRDLAMFIAKNLSSAKINQMIESLNIKELKSFQVFDLYHEPNNDKLSIAYEFCFQSSNKNLTDLMIDQKIEKIKTTLANNLAVEFREI